MKNIFSKIDLIRGYRQIPVASKDVPKTAVVTPFGLWEILRLSFGLKNAAQAFQRLMDTVLQDVECAFVYLDDILVASSDEKLHLDDLKTVYSRLSEHGIVIRQEKCLLDTFLGHHVTPSGTAPTFSKVQAVQNFPRP